MSPGPVSPSSYGRGLWAPTWPEPPQLTGGLLRAEGLRGDELQASVSGGHTTGRWPGGSQDGQVSRRLGPTKLAPGEQKAAGQAASPGPGAPGGRSDQHPLLRFSGASLLGALDPEQAQAVEARRRRGGWGRDTAQRKATLAWGTLKITGAGSACARAQPRGRQGQQGQQGWPGQRVPRGPGRGLPWPWLCWV